MSVERVRAYLARYGLADRVMEFAQSSATVEEAAAAVGVEGARIAKTLSFYHGDHCRLIVAAGDARIDNKLYKEVFSEKARMLSREDALRMTTHAVGGVCPFDVPADVEVYLDDSMRRFDTIYPAAGSASSAVRLSCAELETASQARAWVHVCKT